MKNVYNENQKKEEKKKNNLPIVIVMHPGNMRKWGGDVCLLHPAVDKVGRRIAIPCIFQFTEVGKKLIDVFMCVARKEEGQMNFFEPVALYKHSHESQKPPIFVFSRTIVGLIEKYRRYTTL